jgi:magnesium-transporting ATPase (P-type)
VGLSIIALVVALYDTISNYNRIQEQAHYSCPIKVLRGDKENRKFVEISSVNLVPGDVIQVPD